MSKMCSLRQWQQERNRCFCPFIQQEPFACKTNMIRKHRHWFCEKENGFGVWEESSILELQEEL